jgi:hypothetical protein
MISRRPVLSYSAAAAARWAVRLAFERPVAVAQPARRPGGRRAGCFARSVARGEADAVHRGARAATGVERHPARGVWADHGGRESTASPSARHNPDLGPWGV